MDALIDISGWFLIAAYFATSFYIVSTNLVEGVRLFRQGRMERFPYYRIVFNIILYLLISPLIAMRIGVDEMT